MPLFKYAKLARRATTRAGISTRWWSNCDPLRSRQQNWKENRLLKIDKTIWMLGDHLGIDLEDWKSNEAACSPLFEEGDLLFS